MQNVELSLSMDDLLQLFDFCDAGNRDYESILLAFDEAIEFILVPGGHCGGNGVGIQSRSPGRPISHSTVAHRWGCTCVITWPYSDNHYLARLRANGAHDSPQSSRHLRSFRAYHNNIQLYVCVHHGVQTSFRCQQRRGPPPPLHLASSSGGGYVDIVRLLLRYRIFVRGMHNGQTIYDSESNVRSRHDAVTIGAHSGEPEDVITTDGHWDFCRQ
jgi:hypothetical protein